MLALVTFGNIESQSPILRSIPSFLHLSESVIPAKAGIQNGANAWTPAFAGVTNAS
jgi:hypothetical protein